MPGKSDSPEGSEDEQTMQTTLWWEIVMTIWLPLNPGPWMLSKKVHDKNHQMALNFTGNFLGVSSGQRKQCSMKCYRSVVSSYLIDGPKVNTRQINLHWP